MAFTVEAPFFLPYGKAATWTYTIHGTGTQAEAYNALVAVATPTNLFGSSLQDVQLTRLIGFHDGEAWYEGVISYGPAAQAERPGPSPGTGTGTVDPGWKLIGFELGVTTETVTQSNAPIARYPGTAENYYGAIGVTDSGVGGAQKWVRTLAFTLQKRLPVSDLTDSWIRTKLAPLQLHYNNATWRGFAAGEVLFYTASGQIDGGDLVLTGQFLHEANITGLSVGSITGIAKKGWEWSWTKHVEIETSNKREVKPYAVYIEQLYDPGDFSLLGA